MTNEENIICENGIKIYNRPNTFYNPAQKLNRDITFEIVNEYFRVKKHVKIFCAMEASGIRGIRYLKSNEKYQVYFNDISSEAIKSIEDNLKLNGIYNFQQIEKIVATDTIKAIITQKDCNIAMLETENYFDVIDIDPFGSCNKFVDNAFKSIKHNGLICFTCTDKAALCSKVDKCFVKYHSSIKKNFCKNELPIRVLLSFISRASSKYEYSIIPIVSFSVDYYLRVIIKVKKGHAKNILKTNSYFLQCQCGNTVDIGLLNSTLKSNCDYCQSKMKLYGPFWNNVLHDVIIINKVLENIVENENERLVGLFRYFKQELAIPFYYEMSHLSRYLKQNTIKMKTVLTVLSNMGYEVSLTHCNLDGFKTNAPIKVIYDVLVQLQTDSLCVIPNPTVEALYNINFYKKLINSKLKPGSLPKK